MRGAYKRLMAVVGTRRDVGMVVYGRGRNRTLAICRAGWRWQDDVLAKAHYSVATQDEAAVSVVKQMQLDGALPDWMTRTLT